MTNNTCKNCRFGKPVFDSNQQLEAIECHRNSPEPQLVNEKLPGFFMLWPLMYPGDFCGQHQI